MPSSPLYDVVLVGGGLVGACLAEELATGGATVLVLDAGGEPGHATTQAAGVAVPSLRHLGDEEFHRWLVDAQGALRDDIRRLEPGHGPFSLARPMVRLLTDDDVRALPEASGNAALGQALTSAELDALAPGVRVPAGRRPFMAEDGLLVNGGSYLRAVRAAALAAGAGWRQETTVSAVEEEVSGLRVRAADGFAARADRVVLTAGAWTGQLAPLPIGPQRGQLAVLEADAELGCILSGRLYMAPLPDGRIVVGATEEQAGFADHCTAGTAAGLLAYAVRTLPDLSEAVVSELRAGLRPLSGTGRPLVGRVPGRSRLYVAAGHAGHGLISSRLTARGLAAGLLRCDWEELPERFCPNAELSAGMPATVVGR
ncbi:FAD-dependent oxidoreductase [Streptomyces sp. NPDC086519]|uniref:NAD(P)/FAD-dependent oxidoreductase n=1 Tax=Streptomyces sp. NPDC086519 TaxID=3154863 RepID=UPI00343AB284